MSIDGSRPPRVRRSPEAARDNILAAAETLLTAHGPQALKLADVAQAAGVANGTVLHHFGSIDGVQTALMDRMIAQIVEAILAGADGGPPHGIQVLLDTFEKGGAARLAAWLELTGEWRRLTTVQDAVRAVLARKLGPSGMTPEAAESAVLLAVVISMGVGLFGRSVEALMGQPPGSVRALAEALLKDAARGPEEAG